MANYHRGRVKEWRCQSDLAKMDIPTIRASSSKGFADVVGVDARAVYFIQNKRSKRKIVSIKAAYHAFREDIDKMFSVVTPSYAQKWVWLWTDGEGWRYYRILDDYFIEYESFPDGKEMKRYFMGPQSTLVE